MKHFRQRTWRIQVGIDEAGSSVKTTSLTALQESTQVDKGVERTIVLPSCNVHEPQEWPEWQGVQKVQ